MFGWLVDGLVDYLLANTQASCRNKKTKGEATVALAEKRNVMGRN